jgi:hypothetical protein
MQQDVLCLLNEHLKLVTVRVIGTTGRAVSGHKEWSALEIGAILLFAMVQRSLNAR